MQEFIIGYLQAFNEQWRKLNEATREMFKRHLRVNRAITKLQEKETEEESGGRESKPRWHNPTVLPESRPHRPDARAQHHPDEFPLKDE